jgi:hypothetical protein
MGRTAWADRCFEKCSVQWEQWRAWRTTLQEILQERLCTFALGADEMFPRLA